MAKSEFDNFIAEDVRKQKGIYMPIKAGMFERMLKKRISLEKLHANPEDEFTFPDIGPNYQIISKYVEDILTAQYMKREPFEKDPIIVEKMHPHGYLILNGHHRWAAAVKMKLKKIRVKITNLASESDIKKILERSNHDKRATLDLDEVVFRSNEDPYLEKALKFPYSIKNKQRIRLGIPSLFYFLTKSGYDIWVYSSKYYSIDDIKEYFRCYHVPVTGIITGMEKKSKQTGDTKANIEKLIANKYTVTLHIDNEMLLRTEKETGEFKEFDIDVPAGEWAQKVITIIEEMEKNEKKI